MGLISLEEKELVSCCGSGRFAEMVAASSPFPNINEALRIAKDVWLNSVDVNGWLQAFAAHPQIGDTQFKAKTSTSAENVYRIADDRMGIIGSHLTASSPSVRTRPPITTHILDVVRRGPASGIEVILERWNGLEPRPTFNRPDSTTWVYLGSATTDRDGRSGQLIPTVDYVSPGLYRIRFNTGKYFPDGFFPYASIIFEIKRTQTAEHFHVPLILSPFSFSTYRGS